MPKSQRPVPALLSIAILAFIGTLIETSMNVTFPTLMQGFQVSLPTVQWITSGYLIVMALTMMCSAFLQRRFTLLNLFDAAAGLFILGASLALLTRHNFALLILGRLIQAGCAGITIPLMVNFILAVIPVQKLGYYMSTAGMIVNLAPALGPTFGGWMTALGNWRLIFITTLPIIVLAWALGRPTLRPFSKPGIAIKFSVSQFTLLVTAFLVFNFGLSQLKNTWLSLVSLVVATLISSGLIWWFNHLRQHNQSDLLNLSLFKQANVRATILIYTLIQFTNLCVNLVIPNLVQLGQHVNAFKSGLILLPGSLLVAIINPYFGKLYDRFGARLPISGGLALMLLGLLGLALSARLSQLGGLILFYVLFSTGRTMSFGNTLTETLRQAAKSTQSDLNALYSTGQQLAGSIGSTFGGILLALPIVTGIHPNIMINGQIIFGLLAVAILGILVVSLKVFKQSKTS